MGTRSFVGHKQSCFLAIPILLLACDDGSQIQDPHAPQRTQATTLTTALAPGKPTELTPEDLALKRTYGAADVRLNPCTKLLTDGSIEGKGCANGIVTYGPYITAPPDSDLSFAFDIKSTAPITVGGDIISRDGTEYHTHALIKPVTVQPGKVERIEQQVHLSQRAIGTEARIGVQSQIPASFTLSNIKIAVQ